MDEDRPTFGQRLSELAELGVIEFRAELLDCAIWERFRRYYEPLQRRDEVKLDQDDADKICRFVVDHDLDTGYVADRYDISRRRVQQLAMLCCRVDLSRSQPLSD